MSDPALSVPLRFAPVPEAPARRGEPVTLGLPWPRGAVTDERHFRLIGPDGSPQSLQTKVLDRWPDGSVRWGLFDFRADVGARDGGYRIEVGHSVAAPPADLETAGVELFSLEYRRGAATSTSPVTAGRVLEDGPVRRRVELVPPKVPDLEVFGYADLFLGLPVARVRLTVRNPKPAAHPGGNWDLGAGGSVIGELPKVVVFLPELHAVAAGQAACTYRVSPERGRPFRESSGKIELRQESSGGENWNSSNHVTRHRTVTLPYRGYRLTLGDAGPEEGLRATPIAMAEEGEQFAGITSPAFWENFPKAVIAAHGHLVLDLFPGETELQGGEQKTHEYYVAFGKDGVTAEPMAWCRSPLVCHADPEWYAASGAVPYLTPRAADPNAAYLALVDQAVEGPDTFLAKREKIDEFGWRNFGDLYGDHEAVSHTGPTPLISHYNNQYDCVAGFCYQFLRGGDLSWWRQMLECADHTCDIDVYHTDGDKAAYNSGLFWHTYHYADADTSTHRSYPKALRQSTPATRDDRMGQLGETAAALKKAYAVGGGPAASHNYNRGLMLAYFLTGRPEYKEIAVGLAKFVIDMDDPGRTPFRFLSREYTGLATESGGGGYHGPGRAAANSVLALLVGHQLTGESDYLAKAEQLIRRVSHPQQDLQSLDLLNAELRWFYTMFLQALGAYLDYKIELGQLDGMYAYSRETLSHYAHWMAANERPILDTPEKLQYPTETWAAQDMRKVEVFQFAAKYAAGDEKAKFLERADWFFRYVERTLPTFPTKSLCRPVVLMMNFGWSRAWWQRHPDAAAPPPVVPLGDVGRWRMFVPQKAIAMKRAKTIVTAGAVVGVVAVAAVVYLLLR